MGVFPTSTTRRNRSKMTETPGKHLQNAYAWPVLVDNGPGYSRAQQTVDDTVKTARFAHFEIAFQELEV
jgi:hypothetical protein